MLLLLDLRRDIGCPSRCFVTLFPANYECSIRQPFHVKITMFAVHNLYEQPESRA